jgi:hypothetical protein
MYKDSSAWNILYRLKIPRKKITKTNQKTKSFEKNARVSAIWKINGKNEQCTGTVQKVTKNKVTIKYDDMDIRTHPIDEFYKIHKGTLIIEI